MPTQRHMPPQRRHHGSSSVHSSRHAQSVVQPVAREGVVHADEDTDQEPTCHRRPLRAQDLAMLAAAGVPLWCPCSPARGDGLLPRGRGGAAEVRDAARAGPDASALRSPRWWPRPAAGPLPRRRHRRRSAAATALRATLATATWSVVSAGYLGQVHNETAASSHRPADLVMASRSGRASPPCSPAVAQRPMIGLPGRPRSALVVFRAPRSPAGAPGRRLDDAAA